MTDLTIHGAGGGGKSSKQRTPKEAPNTLRSVSKGRILDLIAHGPIHGLVNGLQSIYLDDTPLQNPDGSFNFEGVTVHTRNGYPDQDYIPGFPAVENTISVSSEVTHELPIIRTTSNPDIDAAVVTVQVQGLTSTDAKTGDINGSSVMVAVDVRHSGGAWLTLVTDTIKGKTNSAYQRSYRVPLNGTAPFDIRVRRITPDSDTARITDKLAWTTLTEVVDTKLSYPDSALVGIELDAALFGSSMPSRSYDMKLSIINVPSNYDPLTRTYTGMWDGLFKKAWTDNPAWAFYDLATDPVIGADVKNVDKWSLYQIGRYCDELVPDGYGVMEPRFTINTVFADRQDAINVLADLASVFRGMCYWGSDSLVAVGDMPADPVKLVTPANVINGEFEYSGTSLRERHSVAIVMWNDPADNYRQKPEFVEDPESIDLFGWRETQVTALGCTSRGQARRLGKWILYSERAETQTVNYAASMDHADLRPGDFIELADPDQAGARMGGRVLQAGTNTLTLDKVPAQTASDTWFLSVTMPNGSIERKQVLSFAGDTVNLLEPLSVAPLRGAVWVLTSLSVKLPLYRVTAVTEDAEKLEYKITATEHDPTKYSRVELDLALPDTPTSYLPTGPVAPVLDMTAKVYTYLAGGVTHQAITISWPPSTDVRVTEYMLEAQGPRDVGFRTLYVGAGTSFDEIDAAAGQWMFRLKAIAGSGRSSPWSSLTTQISNLLMPVAPDGVQVTVGPFSVTLRPYGAYPGATYEFWRSTVVLTHEQIESNAVLLGTAPDLVDVGLDPDTQYYYYIRGSNAYGLSTWYPVQAKTSNDPAAVLKLINKQITESELGQHLTDRIDLIDGPATNPETVAGRVKAEADARVAAIQAEAVARANADAAEAKARQDGFVAEAQSRTAAILVESQARATAISTEKTERQAADGNLSQRIDTVSAASAGNAAAIQQEATARANADSALSSRIDTTAATAAGNTAAITAEQTARANADSALSSRIDTVTASAANNAAAITAEQTARANADSALTQRVDSLQARSGLFDAALNYGFDAGLEGWSATRLTLAVGGGVITATATGTSAYLSSPSNLAIEGKTSTKVRMRITRRAGSGWLGYVTYATANHGSGSAYRKIVADPGLAVGQSAIVEWDMAALTTGGTDWVDSTITRFHIWLTSTVDDVFEIDWIAVGKESPAASTASLLAEQQARAAGDTANAQAITAAESRITNTETQQAAQATALSGLTTRVSTVESTVSSNSSSITSLTNGVTTADGKAAAAQQAAQDAATLAGSKGKVIVQSSAPATADRQAQNLWIDTTNNANTPKRWSGSAWVAVTDKVATDAAAAAAQALQGLGQKADASALQALDTRVTSTETTLTSQGQSITSLTNTVGTKNRTYRQASAPTTGLTVGDLWVNTTAGQNNKLSRWNGTTWDDTTDPRIPAAATAEALNSLSNTVTQQGNTLTSQGQSITSLSNRVTSTESVNTAQAGAISSLDTRVTSTEGTLSSQASRIDGISAQINPPLAGDMGWNAGATSVLAGVWSEQSARASEDMALGQRIDTVVAQVGQNAAAITAEQTARATADSALASQVETLSAKVNNDIAAALQSEATARADADGALSSRIDTAQAKADSASASVQTVSQAQATTDGKLAAMWSVKLGLTADGKYYGAGMGIGVENTPQGMQSQVLFQADRFAVINVANGQITTPFVIHGGQVYINSAVIGDASITMAKIADSLQSTNYVANQQGWRLDKTGAFEINGMVAGQGRLKITNQLIEVFDSNDMRRVRLGIWA